MFGCVSREENLAKIARRVKDYKVEEMNAPREGKRLLVLDVDYTLFGKNVKNMTGRQLSVWLQVFFSSCGHRHVFRVVVVVVVVKTTRHLANYKPKTMNVCQPLIESRTLCTDVCMLCVFRSQVVCRNGSGADETIPPRVSDISLRGLRHCHLVYVSLFYIYKVLTIS